MKNDKNKLEAIKVALLMSDFHIGELYGAVARRVPENTKVEYCKMCGFQPIYIQQRVADMITVLRDTAKAQQSIPYLILLGDIIDMAVDEMSDAINLTHDFFNAEIDGQSFISFFDEVIYVPGNHDHHVWQMCQERFYVDRLLKNNKEAVPFVHQTVGLLDLQDRFHLYLDGVEANKKDHSSKFLSMIFSNGTKPVYTVYPNLYIKYNDGICRDKGICATHGHFFEPEWNKNQSVIKHFPELLPDAAYFKNLEKYNAPFTELSDYAIAQVSQTFVRGINDVRFTNDPIYACYMQLLSNEFPEFFTIPKEPSTPQSDIEKLCNHSVHVFPYLEQIVRQMSFEKISFGTLVYGHTHVPCFNRKHRMIEFIDTIKNAPRELLEHEFIIHNTGGWVYNTELSEDACIDNATEKGPNPLFLKQDGTISKALCCF